MTILGPPRMAQALIMQEFPHVQFLSARAAVRVAVALRLDGRPDWAYGELARRASRAGVAVRVAMGGGAAPGQTP